MGCAGSVARIAAATVRSRVAENGVPSLEQVAELVAHRVAGFDSAARLARIVTTQPDQRLAREAAPGLEAPEDRDVLSRRAGGEERLHDGERRRCEFAAATRHVGMKIDGELAFFRPLASGSRVQSRVRLDRSPSIDRALPVAIQVVAVGTLTVRVQPRMRSRITVSVSAVQSASRLQRPFAVVEDGDGRALEQEGQEAFLFFVRIIGLRHQRWRTAGRGCTPAGATAASCRCPSSGALIAG